jgi:hypothetical protein
LSSNAAFVVDFDLVVGLAVDVGMIVDLGLDRCVASITERCDDLPDLVGLGWIGATLGTMP